jgi:NAD(P)-dependent dehydrogenase (short-subunit alcohol dehydrogenase family)
VVFVATKNVTAPGADFAAYSASKAAEAQLARVVAIEGGPIGVRANMVNPDAIFTGTHLWDEIRQQRAQAHGISPAEIEQFYRKRSLLGLEVRAEDVAEAVLFLASDRSSRTTGSMLPVDAGVREAFPR